MADNSDLASMLGNGTKSFLEYLKKAPGATVDWLAGGAKSGAEPTLAMMQPGAADQPFLPTADSGGRLGMLASALTGPMMPIKAPSGGAVLGAGPVFRTADKALDMAPEARAQRAAEQGFTADAYHGTTHDIREFDPARIGSETDPGYYGAGFYFAPDAAKASEYGDAVYPVKLKMQNPLVLRTMEEKDALDSIMRGPKDQYGASEVYPERATEWLRSKGYDGVTVMSERYPDQVSEYMIPDPQQIRSRFAAFDPAKAGSSDLLASRAPLPAVPQTDEQKRAAIAALLRNGGA